MWSAGSHQSDNIVSHGRELVAGIVSWPGTRRREAGHMIGFPPEAVIDKLPNAAGVWTGWNGFGTRSRSNCPDADASPLVAPRPARISDMNDRRRWFPLRNCPGHGDRPAGKCCPSCPRDDFRMATWHGALAVITRGKCCHTVARHIVHTPSDRRTCPTA